MADIDDKKLYELCRRGVAPDMLHHTRDAAAWQELQRAVADMLADHLWIPRKAIPERAHAIAEHIEQAMRSGGFNHKKPFEAQVKACADIWLGHMLYARCCSGVHRDHRKLPKDAAAWRELQQFVRGAVYNNSYDKTDETIREKTQTVIAHILKKISEDKFKPEKSFFSLVGITVKNKLGDDAQRNEKKVIDASTSLDAPGLAGRSLHEELPSAGGSPESTAQAREISTRCCEELSEALDASCSPAERARLDIYMRYLNKDPDLPTLKACASASKLTEGAFVSRLTRLLNRLSRNRALRDIFAAYFR